MQQSVHVYLMQGRGLVTHKVLAAVLDCRVQQQGAVGGPLLAYLKLDPSPNPSSVLIPTLNPVVDLSLTLTSTLILTITLPYP